jgi:anaerobic C4-dicarboxylate transporter
MTTNENVAFSRKMLYVAMVVLLIAIFLGARWGAQPVYLAVGFIGEIILVATVHLSSVITHRPTGYRGEL